MAVNLDVPFFTLLLARDEWDNAADELDGNWRRLHKASTDGFSTDVAAAVEAFRQPWVDEIKAVAGVAQDHSDEIVVFNGRVQIADAAQAERIRSLLAWVHRDATITGG